MNENRIKALEARVKELELEARVKELEDRPLAERVGLITGLVWLVWLFLVIIWNWNTPR
jgi:hypothetical protein